MLDVRMAATAVLLAALNAGCAGGAPAAPTASDVPPPVVEGTAVSAIDGAGAGGVSVQVESARPVTTDASGYFNAAIGRSGTLATLVSGPGIVERRTVVNGPTSGPTRLSLIPASFDLAAFDEMFRSAGGRLQRWTSRPSLVVIGTVMSYRNPSDEYLTLGEQMSDDEVALLVSHLTEGLTLLSGGSYTSFASVAIERPAPGERVPVKRDGAIVVGRYQGIQVFTSTIGYGTWAEDGEGVVTGGTMFLDRGFDRDDGRRRLLRIHELGHALGYLHVTSRTSIMNPAIGPEPTAFDRAGAIIAFDRPPGNLSPDTDPQPGPGNAFGPRQTVWRAPVACRR